jgi:cold shock protein
VFCGDVFGEGLNRMATGTVVKWIPERGFGFIRPDEPGDTVFLHVSAMRGAGPVVGDRVSYGTAAPERGGGSMRATNVKVLMEQSDEQDGE